MGRARRSIALLSSALIGTGAMWTIGVPTAAAASATATTAVNIRSGPGTTYDVIGGLVSGQHITTLAKPRGGWVKVRFETSTAYVAAEYLDLSGRAVSAPRSVGRGTKITTATLNVRTGPGLAYRVVGEIRDGSAVVVTGRYARGFAETIVDGTKRWVSGQYLASSATAARARTTGRTVSESLNVRVAPSRSSKVVAVVRQGSTVRATGATDNGYAQIVFRSSVRWVAARYLGNANAAFPSAPPASSTTSARRGAIALAWAKTQLGKPYRFGATGPGSWDCSALAQAAWARAGISIPRTTYAQFKVGTRIARSQLRAGDLVFFYGSNPSHVGLYAGNGTIINAPRPGKRVSYIKISYMPYAGAVRPG